MLKAQSLSFSYPDQNTLAYNFELQGGNKYWLKGASGSGKSTLLKLLSGLLVPNEGKILIGGEELTGSNSFELRQSLVYIPQKLNPGPVQVKELFSQIFSLKANQHLTNWEDELKSYFQLFRLKPAQLQLAFEELSGGEQQRVALIVALMLKRKIMLLDESLSAIDQELRQIVLKELAQTSSLVLLVAHDQPQQESFEEISIDQLKTS